MAVRPAPPPPAGASSSGASGTAALLLRGGAPPSSVVVRDDGRGDDLLAKPPPPPPAASASSNVATNDDAPPPSTSGSGDSCVRVCVRLRPLLPSDSPGAIDGDNDGTGGLGGGGPRSPMRRHASGLATPLTTSPKASIQAGAGGGFGGARRRPPAARRATPRPQLPGRQRSPAWIADPSDPTRVSEAPSDERPSSASSSSAAGVAATGGGGGGAASEGRSYAFDRVYGPSESTSSLYDGSVRSVVEGAVAGYHGSVFAYGQVRSLLRAVSFRALLRRRMSRRSGETPREVRGGERCFSRRPIVRSLALALAYLLTLCAPFRHHDATTTNDDERHRRSPSSPAQTASGKTHTMAGSGPSDPGVVRLAVRDVFRRIRSQGRDDDGDGGDHADGGEAKREYLVRVSYLEIYNEQVRAIKFVFRSFVGVVPTFGRPAPPENGGGGRRTQARGVESAGSKRGGIEREGGGEACSFPVRRSSPPPPPPAGVEASVGGEARGDGGRPARPLGLRTTRISPPSSSSARARERAVREDVDAVGNVGFFLLRARNVRGRVRRNATPRARSMRSTWNRPVAGVVAENVRRVDATRNRVRCSSTAAAARPRPDARGPRGRTGADGRLRRRTAPPSLLRGRPPRVWRDGVFARRPRRGSDGGLSPRPGGPFEEELRRAGGSLRRTPRAATIGVEPCGVRGWTAGHVSGLEPQSGRWAGTLGRFVRPPSQPTSLLSLPIRRKRGDPRRDGEQSRAEKRTCLVTRKRRRLTPPSPLTSRSTTSSLPPCPPPPPAPPAPTPRPSAITASPPPRPSESSNRNRKASPSVACARRSRRLPRTSSLCWTRGTPGGGWGGRGPTRRARAVTRCFGWCWRVGRGEAEEEEEEEVGEEAERRRPGPRSTPTRTASPRGGAAGEHPRHWREVPSASRPSPSWTSRGPSPSGPPAQRGRDRRRDGTSTRGGAEAFRAGSLRSGERERRCLLRRVARAARPLPRQQAHPPPPSVPGRERPRLRRLQRLFCPRELGGEPEHAQVCHAGKGDPTARPHHGGGRREDAAIATFGRAPANEMRGADVDVIVSSRRTARRQERVRQTAQTDGRTSARRVPVLVLRRERPSLAVLVLAPLPHLVVFLHSHSRSFQSARRCMLRRRLAVRGDSIATSLRLWSVTGDANGNGKILVACRPLFRFLKSV
ncbi:hypothetical protein ACHAWF_006694 [Thalassiosira exigua]